MKNIIIISFIFASGMIYIGFTNSNFDKIDNYWKEQERVCGRVGFYQQDGICVPVESIRQNN